MIKSKETLKGTINVKNSINGLLNSGIEKVYPALENLEVTPTSEKQEFIHEESYGYDKVVVNAVSLQDKTVEPTKEQQVIVADESYSGLNQVTVNKIPSDYIIPDGTLEIDKNGTHDVKNYEQVSINVHEPSPYSPRAISFQTYTGKELDSEIESLDTTNITKMTNMFANCSNLINLDLTKFNTTNCTDTQGMFNGCRKINNLDFSSFDTSKVTSMYNMFGNCRELTSLNLSSFVTPALKETSNMFYYCSKLMYLDIRNFTFDNISTGGAGSMFYGIPAACEIIVKGETEKQFVLNIRSDLTNVKTVSEI